MRAALAVLSFAAGVYVSLRAIAALYRVVDLWYALPRAWAKVARPVAFWALVLAAALVLLPAPARRPFAWGAGAFLGFYLSLYVIRAPLLAIAAARARRLDGP